LRLAPVQVAGWGHPVTTGLPQIDYFVSCEAMEPGDGASHYREKLVTLPGLGTHYALPAGAARGARSDFGLSGDVNLYLVPQSLFKIHPDNDALFAAVLEADPRGRLVFFAAHYDAINTAFHRRLSAAFAPRGLAVDDRAVFLPYMTHEEYLRVNTWCDVMLDTLHWSGGNTSLDAIASGLPLVTMPGHFMRGRQSAAMLRLSGMEELVVADAQAYVASAVAIATDRARREELSRRLTAGHGALFSRDEPIRALEEFLAAAVERSRAG
jgi:CRISPR-associated protein Csy1